ncbi:MAG: hypothetical protein HOO98_00525 [Nitrospira sp.]|nr:hypothetical protein [Nitrospira sp.]
MSTPRLFISIVACLLCAGCSYKGMFFAEHTHVGLQAKISPQADAKPIDVNLGYDRGIVAVVPRTAPGENAGSVISKTDLEVVFMTDSKIKNVFATGVAAKNLARDGANVAALFGQCLDDTAALAAEKKTAREKLEPYKDTVDADSKEKIQKLYKTIFPNRTVHSWTTQNEMFRALSNRINSICDSANDIKSLGEYIKKL